uniref:Orf106b n=1 Tax=Batis maritima TaxID=4436 RepID=A0A068BD32_BATMA|nr:orf106b [Batis maritima]AIC83352.1 orf106b [Batis maritima]
MVGSGRSSRFASPLAREVGSGHTILEGNKTHLGSEQQSFHFITEVQSGPAYADLSVVGNDILIEVPVRNECSLENSVEEECSSEASMAKIPQFWAEFGCCSLRDCS